MTREQYIVYRKANDFLSIAFQYYKNRGIHIGISEDFFKSRFNIWPFNQQAINDVIVYYDAEFTVTTIDKDGKTIGIL